MPRTKHEIAPSSQSDKPEHKPATRIYQEASSGFGARLRQALSDAGRDGAWLARELQLSSSTIHDYTKGSMPAADRAFAIANALGVSAGWLVTGTAEDHNQADWITLTQYDLLGADLSEPLPPLDRVPVRRDWLMQTIGTLDDLWFATMPVDYMPEVAREGEPIICQSMRWPLKDGGVYIFHVPHLSAAIRRTVYRPDGVMFIGGPEAANELVAPENVVPIARIVAAFHRVS